MQGQAEVRPGVRVIGLDGDGFVETRARLLRPPEARQRHAAIVPRAGVVGTDGERLVEGRQRFLDPVEVEQGGTPAIVGFDDNRIERRDAFEHASRFLGPA